METKKFKKINIGDDGHDIQISKICCGSMITLAISSCGDVFSWGAIDYNGRITTKAPEWKPVKIEFPKDVKIVDVVCGEAFSVALDDNGKVWSWGTVRVSLYHVHDLSKINISCQNFQCFSPLMVNATLIVKQDFKKPQN